MKKMLILAAALALPFQAKALCDLAAPPAEFRQDREAVARDIASAFKTLAENTPLLTPDERDWFQREYQDELEGNQGVHTDRSLAAKEDLRFSKAQVRAAAGAIVERAGNIAESRFRIEGETQAWAMLVADIVDPDFSIGVERLHGAFNVLIEPLPVPEERLPEGLAALGSCLLSRVVSQID